jgi:hypothetical protein
MLAPVCTFCGVDEWAREIRASGRVYTHYPTGLLKGQPASRLQERDDTLDDPWNYQLAPLPVRADYNTRVAVGEIVQAVQSTADDVTSFAFEELPTAAGTVLHEVVAGSGNLVSSALGIPPAVLWGALAALAYVVLRNPERSRAYVARWR